MPAHRLPRVAARQRQQPGGWPPRSMQLGSSPRHGTPGEAEVDFDRIRELHSRGLEPRIFIHRHGLDDAVALEVEAALIDAYASDDLANEIRGHDSERGMASDRDVAQQYGAHPAVIDIPAILIKIEKQWLADSPRSWRCRQPQRASALRTALRPPATAPAHRARPGPCAAPRTNERRGSARRRPRSAARPRRPRT